MARETVGVLVGISLWVVGVVVMLVAFLWVTRRQRRRREQYLDAVRESVSSFAHNGVNAPPTRLPRGLTKVELDACAPPVVVDHEYIRKSRGLKSGTDILTDSNDEQDHDDIAEAKRSNNTKQLNTRSLSTQSNGDVQKTAADITAEALVRKHGDDVFGSMPTAPPPTSQETAVQRALGVPKMTRRTSSKRSKSADPDGVLHAHADQRTTGGADVEVRAAPNGSDDDHSSSDIDTPTMQPGVTPEEVQADNGKDDVLMTCPVCLDDICVGQRKRTIVACGHTFHSRCLRMWLRHEDTCPCCRMRLGSAADVDELDGIEMIQRAQLALLLSSLEQSENAAEAGRARGNRARSSRGLLGSFIGAREDATDSDQSWRGSSRGSRGVSNSLRSSTSTSASLMRATIHGTLPPANNANEDGADGASLQRHPFSDLSNAAGDSYGTTMSNTASTMSASGGGVSSEFDAAMRPDERGHDGSARPPAGGGVMRRLKRVASSVGGTERRRRAPVQPLADTATATGYAGVDGGALNVELDEARVLQKSRSGRTSFGHGVRAETGYSPEGSVIGSDGNSPVRNGFGEARATRGAVILTVTPTQTHHRMRNSDSMISDGTDGEDAV